MVRFIKLSILPKFNFVFIASSDYNGCLRSNEAKIN
jgi:hypothetical protein